MKSIKITEEQLKRLEELRFTEQETESPEMEIGSEPIVPSVDITLEIADEIAKLVQYFPDVAKGNGIDGLYKKIEFLSNPQQYACLLYTSPSPRDRTRSRMPSSA